MRKLISIAALLACTASWNAYAAPAEPSLPQDERIKLLPYDETDVYTITTKPGYQTNIEFGRGEEILTVSIGDRSFWQVVPSGNRMFIRPLNQDVSTNMTVITNRHSYQFDLKSLNSDDTSGNIYVAKFTYPDRKPSARGMMAPAPVTFTAPEPAPVPAPAATPSSMPFQPAVPPDAPAPAPVAASDASFSKAAPGSVKPPYTPPPCFPPECVPPGAKDWSPKQDEPARHAMPMSGPGITQPVGPNFNYTFSGPDELAPTQVYDDGKSTYITYRQNGEPLPNIYLIDQDGSEHPTTYYVKGGAMVVDYVSPRMALKSSSGTVYIYNELISPQ